MSHTRASPARDRQMETEGEGREHMQITKCRRKASDLRGGQTNRPADLFPSPCAFPACLMSQMLKKETPAPASALLSLCDPQLLRGTMRSQRRPACTCSGSGSCRPGLHQLCLVRGVSRLLPRALHQESGAPGPNASSVSNPGRAAQRARPQRLYSPSERNALNGFGASSVCGPGGR